MSFHTVLLVIMVLGGAASFTAWRAERFSETSWFRWGGLGLWVALLVLMQISIDNLHPADVILIAVANVTWAPFIAYFIVNTMARVARGALSLEDVPVKPSFSQADAAAAKGHFEEAIERYRQIADEFPDDPEPLRRLGELHMKLCQPQPALSAFREAQRRARDGSQKMLYAFLVADFLADEQHDLSAATAELERFLAGSTDADARRYAEARLKALRARTNGW